MQALADTLEAAGYDTYLPHRDGMEALLLPLTDSPLKHFPLPFRGLADESIFCLDVYQLVRECQAVVVSLNGRVPDEGALVEASLAWSLGIPLIFYKKDFRSAFFGRDNSMVRGLMRGPTPLVDKLKDIPAALEKTIGKNLEKTLAENGPNQKDSPVKIENLPGYVRESVEKGEKVNQLLKTARPNSDNNPLLEEIAQKIQTIMEENPT